MSMKVTFPLLGYPPEATYPMSVPEYALFIGKRVHTVRHIIYTHLLFGTHYIVSRKIYILLPDGILRLNDIFSTMGRPCVNIERQRKAYFGTSKNVAKLEKTFKHLRRVTRNQLKKAESKW